MTLATRSSPSERAPLDERSAVAQPRRVLKGDGSSNLAECIPRTAMTATMPPAGKVVIEESIEEPLRLRPLVRLDRPPRSLTRAAEATRNGAWQGRGGVRAQRRGAGAGAHAHVRGRHASRRGARIWSGRRPAVENHSASRCRAVPFDSVEFRAIERRNGNLTATESLLDEEDVHAFRSGMP
jgi:hypothetical protein